jgi:hypothetical protein
MSGELFTSGDVPEHSGCEENLLRILKTEVQKLWERAVVYLDQSRKVEETATAETRRHPDTHEELDYELRLRELEGYRQYDSGPRITNYGRSEPPKWFYKIIVAVAAGIILSAITTTATTIVIVASIRTRVEDYIKSNDQRVSRVEQQTDDNTRRLDRGSAAPL